MYVVKRDGKREPVMFDKITARVRKLCYGLNSLVDPIKISMRVIEGIYDGVTTSELDPFKPTSFKKHLQSYKIHIFHYIPFISPLSVAVL